MAKKKDEIQPITGFQSAELTEVIEEMQRKQAQIDAEFIEDFRQKQAELAKTIEELQHKNAPAL